MAPIRNHDAIPAWYDVIPSNGLSTQLSFKILEMALHCPQKNKKATNIVKIS